MGLRSPKGTSALPRERDAWAFLDVAGITSSRQQEAVITLVRDLKQARLWTKMKAIYPFVGGTATTHKWNLKDPQDTDAAFRLTFSGGWTHASTGALPNGTNAYADTFLIPKNNMSQFSFSASVYLRTNVGATQVDIAASEVSAGNTGAPIIDIYGRLSDNTSIATANSFATRVRPNNTTSLGLFISSRTSNASLKFYKNGTTLATGTATESNQLPSNKTYISVVRDPVAGFVQYSTREQAFASLSDGLTDSEASLLFNCVDRYQKFLGRAV